MVGIVKLMGIIIAVMSGMYCVRPMIIKRMINFWKQQNWLYLGGVLNLVIGIIFLFAASRCEWVWFVVVIGILSLIKGVLLLALGPKRIGSVLDPFLNASPATIRMLGFFGILIGALLILAA